MNLEKANEIHDLVGSINGRLKIIKIVSDIIEHIGLAKQGEINVTGDNYLGRVDLKKEDLYDFLNVYLEFLKNKNMDIVDRIHNM